MLSLKSKHQPRKNSDQQGFTLVEVMISVGILGVLMFAASTHIVSVAQSLENANRFSSQAIAQQSGSYFKEIFNQASPTYHFMKLPIPLTCKSADLPCLRRYDSAVRRFVPNESVASDATTSNFISNRLTGFSNMQFFRDSAGSLVNKASSTISIEPSKTPGGTVSMPRVQMNKPIDVQTLASDMVSNSYYTTWPMKNVNSPPFIVMKQKEEFILFRHIPTLATSKSPGHRYAFFTSRGNWTKLGSLENSLVAVFAINDPTEYSIEYIKKIVPCNANKAQCQAWAQSINSGINTPYTKADGSTSTSFDDLSAQGLIAIEMYNALDSSTPISGMLKNAFPSLSTFNPGLTSVDFSNTNATNFYGFPSDQYSMQDKAGGSFNTDLAPPFDIRRVQHYYTNSGSQAQIALLPVSLVKFWLVKSPGDAKYLNLMGQKIELDENGQASNAWTVMDDVFANPDHPQNKSVVKEVLYFARRLGTPTVDIVIEQMPAVQ